ncbi:O-fucosyltransferase family protein [Anaerostipes faecalis]|uniref:hypothetical protein n=1 Tax=Anaerostipes faecalis TaxID=2738446 RepID=UPI001C1DF8BD|nr:hypothetical protein [Anaerostipes faecalis]
MNIKTILNKMTIKQIELVENVLPKKYTEVSEFVRLDKYMRKTDFEKLSVSNLKKCKIERGEWDYPLFQMSFMNNMLVNIIYCLSNGYLPYVDFKNNEGVNLWEQFLKQPYGCELLDGEETITCDTEKANIIIPMRPSPDSIELFHKLYEKFIVFNEKTSQYIENEYRTILDDGKKRTIGVLCRGTDYTANKPKGHQVQPEIKDVISLVEIKMQEFKCDYIYLATEEKKIVDEFESKFPGKILVNKREYYDQFYNLKNENGDNVRISWVHHDRENDNYLKSLEYLSSIVLLSRCQCLIGGCCGGTQFASYMNGNKYEYCHLFDLGIY